MTDAVRHRRVDPARRDRIVAACLDVVAEVGVAGTSHRRVAARADVPLGSMTYHFGGMDDLLHEAFGQFARTVGDRFEAVMDRAPDAAAARRAVVDLIMGGVVTDARELVLSQELYTLAAREPAFRDLTHDWMARSRRALELHFDPETARTLDALIEGLSLHRALDHEPADVETVRRAVERVAGGAASGQGDAVS